MAAQKAQAPLSPAEAERLVLGAMPRLTLERVSLAEARGRVLREELAADRPFPPYDRVMLDGFALRSSDLAAGLRCFRVVGFHPAGRAPMQFPAEPGACIEVGTGAVLPAGADCVVPYEKVSRGADQISIPSGEDHVAGEAVHACGSDRTQGSVLLRSGTTLGARELAAAAACGKTSLLVAARPRIGLLVTGDELIEPGATVEAWQQRRSNDVALQSALEEAGAHVRCLHARDDENLIAGMLQTLIEECDGLITTGGISRGKMDLLPGLLAREGAKRIFHGVAQRPGKPLWFGLVRGKPVFGLPGNPVSSFICLHRYVLPALDHAAEAVVKERETIAVAGPSAADQRLTVFVPAILGSDELRRRTARLVPFNTSGDLAGLLATDGFVELPPRGGESAPGFLAPFRSWV